MEFLKHFAIYYAVGAVIIGSFFSAMDTVEGNFRGKPIPYPRLVGGIIAGLIWPAVVWQMVAPHKH